MQPDEQRHDLGVWKPFFLRSTNDIPTILDKTVLTPHSRHGDEHLELEYENCRSRKWVKERRHSQKKSATSVVARAYVIPGTRFPLEMGLT